LDVEAQARGTTVYLTHARLDMLPPLLSGDVASLHGHLDRCAVAVTWRVTLTDGAGRPLTPDDDPLALHDRGDLAVSLPVLHACGRVAIRSVAAMTYKQAHELVAGRPPDAPDAPVPPPGPPLPPASPWPRPGLSLPRLSLACDAHPFYPPLSLSLLSLSARASRPGRGTHTASPLGPPPR